MTSTSTNRFDALVRTIHNDDDDDINDPPTSPPNDTNTPTHCTQSKLHITTKFTIHGTTQVVQLYNSVSILSIMKDNDVNAW